jgi:DNA-binding transcriptional LysR family regulator
VDLKKLRTFRAVAQAGSATRAATRLRLTQPAVSRILAGLEAELQFKLFKRDAQRLSLSRDGAAFLREAERLLASAEELNEAARHIRNGRLSRIRIVAMPTLAHGLVPAALAGLKKRHPLLSISVDMRRRAEITSWMTGRQFDLGLAMLPVDYPGLTSRKFASCHAMVGVAKRHRLAKQSTISIKDLAQEPLIGFSMDTIMQAKINQMFERHGGLPPLAIDTSSSLAACHFVASGLGCSIVDCFAAYATRHLDIRFRPLEPALQYEYGVLWEKDQLLSPLLNELCTELSEAAQRIVAEMT